MAYCTVVLSGTTTGMAVPYAGVRNTALKRYDDGFERMLNVMEQAIATSVDQYILSRSPYWINNRIKQGVCHFLVTDGRLR